MRKIMVLLLSLALLFSSCSQEAMYIDDETDDSPLTIYLVSEDQLYTPAIEEYNRLIDSGEIDGRKIQIIEYDADEMQTISDKISTELISGQGPDFLVIKDGYSDLYKLMENGSVADMDILIENNPEFKFEDYKRDILDAGIINGQRCFIPIGYTVPYLLTTQENFEDCNIKLPEQLDIDNLLQIVNTFNQQSSFFSGEYMLGYYAMIYAINHYQENQTLDGEYAELIFNAIEEMNEKYPEYAGFPGYTEELSSGKVSLLLQGFAFPFSLYSLASIQCYDINIEYHKTPVVLNMPCTSSGKPTAFVSDGLAININSKHKNDSFAFILYLLSEQVQLGVRQLGDQTPSLPVNKAAYETAKEKFIVSDYIRVTVLPFVEIPEQFSSQLIAAIEDYDEVIYTGRVNYINSTVLADVPNDLPYEEKIAEMDKRLRIYFSE